MLRFIGLFVGLIIFSGCAKITGLEGGDKDTTAPQLDSLKSTPSGQTNFHPKTIELTFNEWIKLNDVLKNVLVSPPLKKRPIVSLKKKTVIFEFDEEEVLRDSTTYTINFGSAIADITEGNAATGLTYVFSTGPEIDSLFISGKVIDAFTKEPIAQVNVMLYSVLEDSIVYKEKPYYLAVTDKAGQFKINNMRSGTFKAFALKDGDFDYKFSQIDEPMGFLDEPVTVNDSTPSLMFFLSKELAPIRLKGQKHQLNGIKTLEFNRPPQNPSFKPIGVADFRFLPKGDSIKIWYSSADSSSQLVVLSNNVVIDTISLKPKSKDKSITEIDLKVKGLPSNAHPKKPIEIKMNFPILSWNDSLIWVAKDTLAQKIPIIIRIKKDNPTILEMDYAWSSSAKFQLNILPKGIKGINGQFLKDTLTQKITVIPIDKLGNIMLSFVPPDSTQQYVLRLMNKKVEIEQVILKPNQRKITWALVPPGDYSLELIEDRNRNELWDSGNYLKRQQPERTFVKKLEKLRANWDLEIDWAPYWPIIPVKTVDK